MNKLVCTIESAILQQKINVTILMPPVMKKDFFGRETCLDSNHSFKVLYLLHGAFQQGEDWMTGSKIEEYIKDKNVLVVMPDMRNSFYTDLKSGDKYFTYLSQELTKFIEYTFPVSLEQKDTYVAGVSMGGFGAMKWVLSEPNRFGAVGIFSGAMDLTVHLCKMRLPQINFEYIFGKEKDIHYSENDILYMMEQKVKEGVVLPPIYHCCGTDDFIQDMNINFHKKVEELGIEGVYEVAKGSHNWEFWDPFVKHMVDWMFEESSK